MLPPLHRVTNLVAGYQRGAARRTTVSGEVRSRFHAHERTLPTARTDRHTSFGFVSTALICAHAYACAQSAYDVNEQNNHACRKDYASACCSVCGFRFQRLRLRRAAGARASSSRAARRDSSFGQSADGAVFCQQCRRARRRRRGVKQGASRSQSAARNASSCRRAPVVHLSA